jgi:hypothetical protein
MDKIAQLETWRAEHFAGLQGVCVFVCVCVCVCVCVSVCVCVCVCLHVQKC